MERRDLKTILVLAGGPGSEREVSLKSGRAIQAALKERGYRVEMADARPGDLAALDKPDVDLVFPIIHGTFGEDGQLQEALQARGLPFVGSGPEASRTAMDKQATRKVFIACGIPVANGMLIETGTPAADAARLARAFIDQTGLPIVIKPNREGSSVGVTITSNLNEAIEAAMAVTARFGDCLLEQFVAGRELTAGILVDTPLPLVEIRAADGFYDYQAKYIKNDTAYLVEPDMAAETVHAIQAAALRAFQSLNGLDLGRIDFILKPDGRFVALEINTLPGFTDHSLVPKAAARLGWSMAEICDKIVQNAWLRSI